MVVARPLPGLFFFRVNRFRPVMALAVVLVLAASLLALPSSAFAAGGLRVGALTTDGRVNPLGIAGRPQLAWASTSDRRGVTQTAYEVRVGSRPGTADVWASGKVASAKQVDVSYAGPALRSATRYHWQVRVWDDQGVASRWSAPAWFESGLLAQDDWTGAQWLTDTDEALGWTDYTVDTEFTLTALALGVFLRAADNDGYLWQLNVADGTGRPKLRVHRLTDGAYELVEEVDVSAVISEQDLLTGRHHLTISVAGNTITTAIDGARADQRAMTNFTAGTFGYRVNVSNGAPEQAVVHHATVTGADGATLADVDFADGHNPFSGGTVGPDGLALLSSVEAYYSANSSLPLFRTEFTVPDGKQVAAATAYGAARGIYELTLNGNKVGDHELAPGWTDYRTVIQHQTYDVTDQVRQGANAFGIALAPGWYAGRVGYYPSPGLYGRTPSAVAQVRVDHTDGSHQWVRSDSSWTSANGPFVLGDLQSGETYDARLAHAGWAEPGFDDTGWTPAETAESATTLLAPQPDEPVRALEVLTARERTEPTPGAFVYDLGQNMVGVTRLRLTGTAGQTATIRHGEVLNRDGTLYTENLRAAKATDRYTFAADGTVTYEPTFTQHGFRYVEITGISPPAAADVRGVVWGSDLPNTGSFSTSDPMLNQLQSNIVWGQRGNFLSIPTDTPARDERLGWTGDINVFAPTASYNQDTRAFLGKWLADLRATQRANGDYPPIAPEPTDNGPGGVGWADAGVTVPHAVWQAYGDTTIVREHYASMRRFVEFVRAGAGADLLDDGRGRFEDWLNLEDPTPSGVLGTAYFAQDTRMLAEMAAAIGETTDARTYAALSTEVRSAFASAYVAADGTVSGNSQTGYALALGMDLVPAGQRAAVADRFVAKIAASGNALTTGFLGTPWLLPALSGSGHLDKAYELLLRQEYPSWGYEVAMGATTMWERWNSINPDGSFNDPGMNSFNHYAYGAVGKWMYENIAGITPLSAGYGSFLVAPRPGGGLTSGSGSLESAYGTISSSWTLTGSRLRLTVDVPVNTTARVAVPATSADAVTESRGPASTAAGVRASSYADGVLTLEVGSGQYDFTTG
ncbi:family 78 glycoside hydrolase catalytic domain [Actinophytocola sediminis]